MFLYGPRLRKTRSQIASFRPNLSLDGRVLIPMNGVNREIEVRVNRRHRQRSIAEHFHLFASGASLGKLPRKSTRPSFPRKRESRAIFILHGARIRAYRLSRVWNLVSRVRSSSPFEAWLLSFGICLVIVPAPLPPRHPACRRSRIGYANREAERYRGGIRASSFHRSPRCDR